MRTVRAPIALLSLITLVAACTEDEVVPVVSDAGSTTPDAGEPTADSGGPITPMPDSGGMPDSGAPVCGEGGQGEIVVDVNGLPTGVDAAITLQGPAAGDAGVVAVTGSTTLTNSASGDYEATAVNTIGDDPLVRPLFTPAAPRQLFCLPDEGSHTLTVNYQQVATSNKLWALNDVSGAALLAFSSAALSETPILDAGADAGVASAASADAIAGKDLAFDRDGHLWTFGPTTADPALLRYRAAQFTGLATPGFDRAFDINDVACLPAMRAMAFDAQGNLWLSTCGGQVVSLTKTMLHDGTANTTAVDPAVVISGLSANNQDLAFDSDGNLWVADDGKIVRFDADRLGASDGDAPDLSITVRDSGDNGDLVIDYLTFDANGNLWGTDFAGNTLAHIDAADLEGTGDATVVADVSLVLAINALLNRPAIDDAGGLWISYSNGHLVGIGAAKLLLSSSTGSPTDPDVILDGDQIGSIGNVAFFPAAAGLPLYHAYR